MTQSSDHVAGRKGCRGLGLAVVVVHQVTFVATFRLRLHAEYRERMSGA